MSAAAPNGGVALFTHPAALEHDTGPHHPECPDRLRVVLQALEHPDFVPLLREAAPEATRAQLELAHPRGLRGRHPGHPPRRRTVRSTWTATRCSATAAWRASGARQAGRWRLWTR